ncbi:MAG: S8 family serine peptidase [Allosphingosinicella sp.]
MTDRLRILVHTLSADETAAALAGLGSSARSLSDTVIEALASAEEIDALQGANLIVEPVEASGESAASATNVFRSSVRAAEQEVMDGLSASTPAWYRSGTFSLRVRDKAISASSLLGRVGAGVTRALAGGDLISRLNPLQRAILHFDRRVAIAPFNTSPAKRMDISEDLADLVAPSSGEIRDYDLIAHSPDRLPEIEAWLAAEAPEVKIVGKTADRVRIEIVDTSPLLDRAEQLDSVLDVRPVPSVFLCLDRARSLARVEIGGERILGPAGELDGSQEVVGIIDGAVDTGHPDLDGRVQTIWRADLPATAHGTHVAGIIVGNGSRSSGRFCGIAPKAVLKAQAVEIGPKGEMNFEMDFRAVLRRSYQAGVRILNLSFEEDGAPSLYSARADDVDAVAIEHPDLLIVVAAGNRAMTETPVFRPAGEVGLDSISAPGVAKNALTVGASCSDRTDGGHAAQTWSDFAPTRFRSPPTSTGRLSGDDSMIAAFSGRGWGHGGERIKPELVAPGTNIVAPRARGSEDLLWGAHSADYLYSGGTSMAAPVATGAAALVRQYYRQRGHESPSAALLKATLAAGAQWLGGASAAPSVPALPANACASLDQGFGRVDVARALALGPGADRLCFVDVGSAPSAGPAQTLAEGTVSPFQEDLDYRRFWFRCSQEGRFDIALCYTDPVPGPGGAVVALTVQPEGGIRRTGNDAAIKKQYPRFGSMPDRLNTLQVVRVGPTSGKVQIKVDALALLGRTVGFALVVRGPVEDGILHAW